MAVVMLRLAVEVFANFDPCNRARTSVIAVHVTEHGGRPRGDGSQVEKEVEEPIKRRDVLSGLHQCRPQCVAHDSPFPEPYLAQRVERVQMFRRRYAQAVAAQEVDEVADDAVHGR
jgi:hypothetical protein